MDFQSKIPKDVRRACTVYYAGLCTRALVRDLSLCLADQLSLILPLGAL